MPQLSGRNGVGPARGESAPHLQLMLSCASILNSSKHASRFGAGSLWCALQKHRFHMFNLHMCMGLASL
jgi:hypothetical protein